MAGLLDWRSYEISGKADAQMSYSGIHVRSGHTALCISDTDPTVVENTIISTQQGKVEAWIYFQSDEKTGLVFGAQWNGSSNQDDGAVLYLDETDFFRLGHFNDGAIVNDDSYDASGDLVADNWYKLVLIFDDTAVTGQLYDTNGTSLIKELTATITRSSQVVGVFGDPNAEDCYIDDFDYYSGTGRGGGASLSSKLRSMRALRTT
jgi:hypothetical protein